MHPPWIAFILLLLLFAATNILCGDPEQKENNSTISRPSRETYERERRLIPYMTYYITQSLTSSNTGTRQNILLPITQRENIFHIGGVTKIRLDNVQSVNPQQTEILPKPVVVLPNTPLLAHTVQGRHYKPKEDGIYPQIYRVDPGIVRSQVQPQQIQSETQPLQVIKINPLPIQQKYTTPQVIKIIPVIKKLPLDGKPNVSHQAQLAFLRPNVLTSGPNYPQNENAYNVPQNAPRLRLVASTVRPDVNKYTIAKIVYGTTSPSPYTEVKYDGRPSDESHQLVRQPVLSTVPTFTATSSQQQAYYGPDQSHESEDLIQTQNAERLPRLRVPQEEKIRFVASVTPVSVTNDLENSNWKTQDETRNDQQSLNNIFSLLKETNKLPQNLTPDNIEIGIKTLALILERLKQQRSYQRENQIPDTGTTPEPPKPILNQIHEDPRKVHSFPEKSGTSTPGRPGIDYPIYSSIPQTKFDCSSQRYKGFFGDPDTNCQVWHYCDLNGGQASFLCPNGTIFSQVALTCDWWFNVKCASTSQLYVLNERLYKYILPFSPSFPEDFSGPIVDTYLAAKFKEMESKSKQKALKSIKNSTTTEIPSITTEEPTEVPTEEYQTPSTE